MKQKLLFLALVCGAVMMAAPAKAQADYYYYESISNPSKTINFLIGVYVTKNEFITRDDGTGYTKIRMAVINQEGADPLKWSDYKVYIKLKNNEMFYNIPLRPRMAISPVPGQYRPDKTTFNISVSIKRLTLTRSI